MNSSDVAQGILIVCCSSLSPHQFVEGIIGEKVSERRDILFGNRGIESYPWHIETKYYEADVHFLLLPERDLVSESFSESIEAAVFHFDVNKESFESLQTWLPFINEFDPEIKILSCNYAPEIGEVSRSQVQKWCIVNGFEFVELNPLEEEVNDEVEDDFHESNSFLRIRQALHAHPWPQLDLRDPPEYTPSARFQDILSQSEPLDREVTDSTRVASLIDESTRVFEQLHVDDESEGDFENLFERFREMKEKASQLDGNERLLFAEKTAVAFWKAIGGDDEDEAPDG